MIFNQIIDFERKSNGESRSSGWGVPIGWVPFSIFRYGKHFSFANLETKQGQIKILVSRSSGWGTPIGWMPFSILKYGKHFPFANLETKQGQIKILESRSSGWGTPIGWMPMKAGQNGGRAELEKKLS